MAYPPYGLSEQQAQTLIDFANALAAHAGQEIIEDCRAPAYLYVLAQAPDPIALHDLAVSAYPGATVAPTAGWPGSIADDDPSYDEIREALANQAD